MNTKTYPSDVVTIEVVEGGFILTYPDYAANLTQHADVSLKREVVATPSRLHKRFREIVDVLSMVPH